MVHSQATALSNGTSFLQPHFAGHLEHDIPSNMLSRFNQSGGASPCPNPSSAGLLSTANCNQAGVNGLNQPLVRSNQGGNSSNGTGWQGEGLPSSDAAQVDSSGGDRRNSGGGQTLGTFTSDRALRRRRVRRPATRYTDIISDRNSRSRHFSLASTSSRSAPMPKPHPFLPQPESAGLTRRTASQVVPLSLPVPIPPQLPIPTSAISSKGVNNGGEFDHHIGGNGSLLHGESTPVPIPILSGVPIIPVGWKDEAGMEGRAIPDPGMASRAADSLLVDDLSNFGLALPIPQALAKIRWYAMKLGYVVRGHIELEPLGAHKGGKEASNAEISEGINAEGSDNNMIAYMKRTNSPLPGIDEQVGKRRRKSVQESDPVKFEEFEGGNS